MLSDSSAPEGRRTKSRVTGAGRQTAGPPGAAARGHTGLGQDSARRENLPPKVQGCGRAPDVYAGREDTGPALEEPRAQRGTLRGTPGVRGASLSACIHGGDPFPRDTHAARSVRRFHRTLSSAPKAAQAATPGCYGSPPKNSRLWGHFWG